MDDTFAPRTIPNTPPATSQTFYMDAEQKYWFADEPIPSVGPDEVLVAVRSMGLCGSDLEYFKHGICNVFQIRDPLVVIHEASAQVVYLGDDFHSAKSPLTDTSLTVGARVAINPMIYCGDGCGPCKQGRYRNCESLFFHGSASKYPHMQGLGQRYTVVKKSQCYPFADNIPYDIIALCEPLSVCLHAVGKIDISQQQAVVIFGGGPIGQLLTIALKQQGVKTVYLLDIQDFALQQALKSGATAAFNTATQQGVADFAQAIQDTPISTVFEASGSCRALHDGVMAVAPCGTIIQVGTLHGDIPKATAQMIMNKEITYQGSMRFDVEFAQAVSMIANSPLETFAHLVTHIYDFTGFVQGFTTMGDATLSTTKVVVRNHL